MPTAHGTAVPSAKENKHPSQARSLSLGHIPVVVLVTSLSLCLELGGHFPLVSDNGPAHSKALGTLIFPEATCVMDPRASALCCSFTGPSPLQGAPRAHGPSTFDLQMKFVCGQCWRNGQVVEPDKDLKYCSAKARHW